MNGSKTQSIDEDNTFQNESALTKIDTPRNNNKQILGPIGLATETRKTHVACVEAELTKTTNRIYGKRLY